MIFPALNLLQLGELMENEPKNTFPRKYLPIFGLYWIYHCLSDLSDLPDLSNLCNLSLRNVKILRGYSQKTKQLCKNPQMKMFQRT